VQRRTRVFGARAVRRAGDVVAALHRLPRRASPPTQIKRAGTFGVNAPDRPISRKIPKF
jgi:hypothetical protein